MNIITLKTHDTGTVLFTGAFLMPHHGVEAAVAQNISLQNADLRNFDLSHASLDGADLRNADLSGANLYGANLSEIDLTGAMVNDCDLSLACLAQSRLIDVDFSGTSFSETILTGASISDCVFSCPTALTLPFTDAAALGRNTYFHDGLIPLVFTAPPIVITGLPQRIIMLDDVVMTGNRIAKRPKNLREQVEGLYRACA